MKYSRRMLLAAVTIAAGLPLAVTAGTASSAPAPNAPSGTTVAASEATDAAAYWTPARMASAQPAEIAVAPGSVDASIPATELGGTPGRVNGVSGTAGTNSGGGAAAGQEALSVPRPYTNRPDIMNGKVFFTKRTGGNFVCSGTAVNAENKSVVWTAGHCVFPGNGDTRPHLNWVFVPAYSSSFNGHRPFGTYTARSIWSLNGWINSGSFVYDLGAVVVNRVSGVRLVDRVGGQGIQWNFPVVQFHSAFGYPQAAPFTGWTQWRCNGTNSTDPFMPSPRPLKLACNMTGGSSGGGWLDDLSSTTGFGWVNSVNSYKYNNNVNFMYGPYHGVGAQNLFNAVRNIVV